MFSSNERNFGTADSICWHVSDGKLMSSCPYWPIEIRYNKKKNWMVYRGCNSSCRRVQTFTYMSPGDTQSFLRILAQFLVDSSQMPDHSVNFGTVAPWELYKKDGKIYLAQLPKEFMPKIRRKIVICLGTLANVAVLPRALQELVDRICGPHDK